MSIDDETLMAYADGELSGDRAKAVAAAIAADPALAEKVAQHRALRSILSGAFDAVLEAPVPPGLVMLAGSVPAAAPEAEVVDLAAVKARRANRRPSFISHWGAIAAALILGIFAGHFGTIEKGLVAVDDNRLIARGQLAQALNSQLARDDPAIIASPVRIGLTYLNRENHFCRTFSAARADGLSGIACRDEAGWNIRMVLPVERKQAGQYRLAASEEIILEQAQAMMKDEALDAERERKARDDGWAYRPPSS